METETTYDYLFMIEVLKSLLPGVAVWKRLDEVGRQRKILKS